MKLHVLIFHVANTSYRFLHILLDPFVDRNLAKSNWIPLLNIVPENTNSCYITRSVIRSAVSFLKDRLNAPENRHSGRQSLGLISTHSSKTAESHYLYGRLRSAYDKLHGTWHYYD